jgi:hypothetical protein
VNRPKLLSFQRIRTLSNISEKRRWAVFLRQTVDTMTHVQIKKTSLLFLSFILASCVATSKPLDTHSCKPAVERESIPSVSYSRDYPRSKIKEADDFTQPD